MHKHTQEIVKLKLKRLLEKNFFDICDLDAVGKLLGANPQGSESYQALRTVHCMDYNDMSSELRDDIPRMVMEALTPRHNVDAMAEALVLSNNFKGEAIVSVGSLVQKPVSGHIEPPSGIEGAKKWLRLS